MKYISRSFIVILILSLILGLTACQKPEEEKYVPESALALWEKVDATMSTMESMEIKSTVNAVFYNSGYEFKLVGDAYVFASKETHYTENKTTLSCEEISMEQTTSMLEAYYDGKMYHAVNDGTYDQKLCSAMTHEEYDQIQTGALTDELNLADCTRAQFLQNEDGTWNLEFSGYTKKAIDTMLESFSMTPDMLGVPIADVKVSLCANADFLVQKMEFSFDLTVEDEEMTPAFLITAEYANYNTAVFDATKLKTEEFAQVDDVRVLEALQTLLKERQDAASGKFTLDLKSTYQMQSQTSASQETDVVTYGRKNGAYYYNIIAQVDGKSFDILYQNGEQAVTTDGKTTTASQSEQEAKLFIDGLINTGKYISTAITDIQKLNEGVYLLIGAPTNLDQTMGLTGIEVTSAKQECTVTFESNKLMKIENKLVIEGTYSADTVTITVESLAAFDDTTTAV